MTYIPDKSGITDELELGERAADYMLIAELGALYSRLEDRAWSVVLQCYTMVYQGAGEDEALKWWPQFDENEMWKMPAQENEKGQ